ncbi:MAG: nucleotide exchange factor GrpE [Clostridia bacterium]|nr:nucleotide exchange factor GrpE [Clostridia bacterium]
MDEVTKNPEVEEQETPATPVKEKKSKAKGDSAKVEKLKKELEETQDAYKRVLAEYANYKRRTDMEKENLGAFTRAETVKALLPAIDNLERAVAAPAGDDYKTGVDMIIRQLTEILHNMGLEEIAADGAPFDPEIHNAVMREDADGVEPETVTAVFQKGYRMGDRILRPAMVKVAN